MKKVIVIGAGAAGMMAAIAAAENDTEVIILEKMPKVGRKLLITGKGRCNVTNSGDMQTFIKNMPGNGSFLYSALNAFNNQAMIDFLAKYNVPTKCERGGRIFPVSDKAIDVVNAFLRVLANHKVKILTEQRAQRILVENNRITGIITTAGTVYHSDAVILCSGGASYPATGSSGDGYVMAREVGHHIVPLKPSLVPLEVAEEWITELQGLSLKNVTASVITEGRKTAEEFGEMLFTHFGLSGPIILSLSKVVADLLSKKKEALLEVNLKPALTEEVLDKRLQRDFEKFSRKQLKNSLHELLPAKIIPAFMDIAFLDPDKPVHQITKQERSRLVATLSHLTFTVTSTRSINEAIVTAGGVSTKEINPATMQSKLVQGLFFAGEVIDIDGYTGGFNLQAAFSTGYVAGKNAAY